MRGDNSCCGSPPSIGGGIGGKWRGNQDAGIVYKSNASVPCKYMMNHMVVMLCRYNLITC